MKKTNCVRSAALLVNGHLIERFAFGLFLFGGAKIYFKIEK